MGGIVSATLPHWEPDPAGEAYTLIAGDIRCRIWRGRPLGLGSWNAIVSQRGDATAAYKFETAEAARLWCERLIAERQRR
jgi:hypothetical protein